MKQFIGLFLVRTLVFNLILAPITWACMMYIPSHNLPKKLVKFNTCQELENHIEKVRKKNERAQAKRVKKRSRGLIAQKGATLGSAQPEMVFDEELTELSDTAESFDLSSNVAGAPASAPKDIVATNNQVEKVDEADFVKFNGKHIFQLHKGSLKILKAWPASKMNIISSLAIDGDPQELLIHENSAVVLANNGSKLTASVVDFKEIARPKILTQFEIPGYYKTARLIGNTLRIVSQNYVNYNNFWRAKPVSRSGWTLSANQTREINIQPTVQITGNQKTEYDTSNGCKNVWVPEKANVETLTRIISIDMSAKKYEETLAFIQPSQVYVSKKNIYIASQGTDGSGNYQQKTALSQFAIKSGQNARYLATGVVDGTLLNQFAMDEYKGHLRLAVQGVDKSEGWRTMSRIHVLRKNGKKLKQVGLSTQMGQGERLYSVRFAKDKAYAVTFRQVDPLYTIDLSRPTDPRVIGELKVPGFSTYIHQLDSTHLLTIGKDADEKTGRVRGLKLSIFSVRDFKNPKEVKTLLFNKGVSSEASYQHKAFSFYRKKGILAIPATSSNQKSALLLFKVGQETLKEYGEIDMTDMFTSIHSRSTVRRSFFADDIVYAIGSAGVRATNLNQLGSNLSTVYFEKKMANMSW